MAASNRIASVASARAEIFTTPPSRKGSASPSSICRHDTANIISEKYPDSGFPPEEINYSMPPCMSQFDPIGSTDQFEEVDLADDFGSDSIYTINTIENMTSLGLSFGIDLDCEPALERTCPTIRFSLDEGSPGSSNEISSSTHVRGPFERWVKKIHRRASHQRRLVSKSLDQAPESYSLASKDYGQYAEEALPRRRHKKSSSSSSMGFVTAMKSASISIASMNIAPCSRKDALFSRHLRSDRSSVTSAIRLRHSEDGYYKSQGVENDLSIDYRAVQRRRVLEEIISSEESYVADIRFLLTVYNNFLASIKTLSTNLRSSIISNLTDIVQLHEELLGALYKIVPNSEFTQPDAKVPDISMELHSHHRCSTLNAVPRASAALRCHTAGPGLVAEPETGVEVANLFGQRLNRFFAYEEYGAKYEAMVRDVASTRQTMLQWDEYQKGLETLASIISASGHSKKSLSAGDLLVKPIQRICKYPLLFAELLKHTPVCDGPQHHMEIENVLIRLREATAEINRATDDPLTRLALEKTWRLQDRLQMPEELPHLTRSYIRGLGRIRLCGALHCVWQTHDGAAGQYMICLLYRGYLVLALPARGERNYDIHAVIETVHVRVEEVQNGRGLQSHDALFSWKIIFECDSQLYEIIFSACSFKEEQEWRRYLLDKTSSDKSESAKSSSLSMLQLNIRPLGAVFGKPGTVARRISIKRATTLGAKSVLCHVFIRNTTAAKCTFTPETRTSLTRSRSLLSGNRIPIFTPSRGDRIRLEGLLSDVWTRDILPYPGMAGRARSELTVRSSAQSVIRKLSATTIGTNFTNRSGSLASLKSFNRRADSPEQLNSTPMPQNSAAPTVMHFSPYPRIFKEPLMDSRLMAFTPQLELASITSSYEVESNVRHNEKIGSSLHQPLRGEPRADGAFKRLKTLRMKRSWSKAPPLLRRDTTPPLRVKSSNSTRSQSPICAENKPSTGDENGVHFQKPQNIAQGLKGARPFLSEVRGFFH